MLRLNRSHLVFLHDLLAAGLAPVIALWLRVGNNVAFYQDILWLGVPLFVLASAIAFRLTGMYRGIWRYASMNDLMSLMRGVSLAVLIFLPLMFFVTRLEFLPRSLPILTWLVLMVMLGAPRFLYRRFKDNRMTDRAGAGGRLRVPLLLIGAGDSAELFIRALQRDESSGYRVLGMVSVSGTRVGRNMHGIEVLGRIEDLESIVEKLRARDNAPQRVVVTEEQLDGALVRSLFDRAEKLGLTIARLPKPTELRANDDAAQIRPIAVEDLLGRPQTVLDRDSMRNLIQDRRVLITGAGGSIGSELVRQICDLGPAHIALLDASEFALYSIDMEASQRHAALSRSAILADVRDAARMARVMAEEKPELVFHAAALKHVPMVEANPHEGLLTNAIGTRIVADACRAANVAVMVQISTDKAVNPTNIMGASKRIAESYAQAQDLLSSRAGGTRYVTVRFGNVLGSTGSVVPLFQKQLAAGGPITVTHPDMTRYFMTIREAVELVLQASALGVATPDHQGKIFVLDMGEPVKIVDLARQMIRLAGLRPDTDIKIDFTGIRPGEKLFEEIFHGAEPPIPTERKGILLASPRPVDQAELARALDALEAACRSGDPVAFQVMLPDLVRDYIRPQPAIAAS